MGSELFSGDIETVEIPEGGLELAPSITLHNQKDGSKVLTFARHGIWNDEQKEAWDTMRQLFLRPTTRQADTTLERVKGFYLGLSCFSAQLRDDSDLRDGVMRVLQMMRDDFPELLEGQSKETGWWSSFRFPVGR